MDYRVSRAAFSLSPSCLRYAGRLLAIDRPGYAELIDKHAKADAPEGFLEGHLHGAAFRKRVKYPFCIHRVIDAKQHGETPLVVHAAREQGRRPSKRCRRL